MGIALVAITLWAAGSFNGTAQAGIPDAKDEGMIAHSGTMLSTTGTTKTSGWVAIDGLDGDWHKAQWKDLVLDVSLECGLYTDTEVKSKSGNKDTSNATAGVKVRVRVENINTGEVKYMTPGVDTDANGGVVFCRLSQTLSAGFQGLFILDDGATCLEINEDGDIVLLPDCLEPEEVQLILDTMTASAFNFILEDLPQEDTTYKLKQN